MNLVQQAQQFYAQSRELECVENTYIPRQNGHRRIVGRVGKTSYACTVDGKAFRGTIPTRVRDVVAISDDEITHKIGRDGHTVTLRRVA